VNGVVEILAPGELTVGVRQSFGNCPRYIQARSVSHAEAAGPPGPPRRRDRLNGELAALVGSADTFYLASAAQGPAGGADVSHRGGRPGFVVVESDRVLTVPDYAGNFYFNTIGNLLVQPRAGLLFLDFDRGDAVQITARAEIVWEGPEVEDLPGAERLVRFTIQEVIHLAGVVPLRWGAPRLSPFLEEMD
jgi:hypothetical protein